MAYEKAIGCGLIPPSLDERPNDTEVWKRRSVELCDTGEASYVVCGTQYLWYRMPGNEA